LYATYVQFVLRTLKVVPVAIKRTATAEMHGGSSKRISAILLLL